MDPQDYVAYELVLTSPVVSRMFGSSNLDTLVVGGRTAIVLWGVASRTCSLLLAAFLCNCRQAFFPYV